VTSGTGMTLVPECRYRIDTDDYRENADAGLIFFSGIPSFQHLPFNDNSQGLLVFLIACLLCSPIAGCFLLRKWTLNCILYIFSCFLAG
jgi:hypothetical protein